MVFVKLAAVAQIIILQTILVSLYQQSGYGETRNGSYSTKVHHTSKNVLTVLHIPCVGHIYTVEQARSIEKDMGPPAVLIGKTADRFAFTTICH